LKDPESARGPNINWLWYDEFGRDEDGAGFRIAIPSVRVGKDPHVYLTGTPNGDDHWGSKLLIDQEFPEEVYEALKEVVGDRPLVECFHGSTYDNKDNLDPATFALILTMYAPGTWLYNQEILGEVVSHGGVLGNTAWFKDKIIERPPEVVKGRLRYYDLAATEKKVTSKRYNDPDETVGTKMSFDRIDKDLIFYIEHQKSGYWDWKEIKEQIYQTALDDGPYVQIVVEQEPAAGGKNQVAELAECINERLPGWPPLEGLRPEGDKVMRANVWFAEAAAGHVYMVYGDWNSDFLKQLSSFPTGRHDDKIDSVSGARHSIAPIRSWATVPFMRV